MDSFELDDYYGMVETRIQRVRRLFNNHDYTDPFGRPGAANAQDEPLPPDFDKIYKLLDEIRSLINRAEKSLGPA